jgi:hypothetical protein
MHMIFHGTLFFNPGSAGRRFRLPVTVGRMTAEHGELRAEVVELRVAKRFLKDLFPRKERLHMPGSSTTPGRSDLAMVRPKRVAFRDRNSVGTRGLAFAAQWLAYALPYRRFVAVLADANARLGADVDRYSFIVVDLHHLLLAGLPAHFESDHLSHAVGSLPANIPA